MASASQQCNEVNITLPAPYCVCGNALVELHHHKVAIRRLGFMLISIMLNNSTPYRPILILVALLLHIFVSVVIRDCVCCKSSESSPICLPSAPFHRNISLIHPRPHHHCYWFTKTIFSLSPWSFCCLWHHRPWDFTHSALILVWYSRLCSQLV